MNFLCAEEPQPWRKTTNGNNFTFWHFKLLPADSCLFVRQCKIKAHTQFPHTNIQLPRVASIAISGNSSYM